MLIVDISTSGSRCCDQQHSFPSFQARLPAWAAGAGGTLRREQIDFKTASLHVLRAKNGTPSAHPLTGRELRKLHRHQRESPKSPFVLALRLVSPGGHYVGAASICLTSRALPLRSIALSSIDTKSSPLTIIVAVVSAIELELLKELARQRTVGVAGCPQIPVRHSIPN